MKSCECCSCASGTLEANITFSWNDLGECVSIGFSTQSFYIPEHVEEKGKKGKKKK